MAAKSNLAKSTHKLLKLLGPPRFAQEKKLLVSLFRVTLQTQWNDIRGETSLPIGKTLENERLHLFTFKDWCLSSQIALQVVIKGTGPNIDTSIHSIVFI